MTHNARVLNLLSDGQPHTHHELYALNVIAHSRVADLRKQGHKIAQWRAGLNGETLYVYQLVGSLDESGCYSASVAADGATGGRAPGSSRDVEQPSLFTHPRTPEWER